MLARMETVTLRNVELVRAGTWNASTGVATISVEDLDAAIAAAQDDDLDRAPVKIGHVDARFDGEPALGWVENLRRVGDTLVGDLVDVPARLAAIMPKAFRRRSVELAFGVRTPAGRLHRAALTGLALLGVAPPAVKGLADVLDLYETGARVAASSPEAETVSAIDVVDGFAGTPATVAAVTVALAGAVAAGETTQAAADAILDRVYATAGIDDATIPHAETTPGDTSGRDHPGHMEDHHMPVDENRLRELLRIENDADVEAAITDLLTRAETPGGNGEETPAEEPAETPAETPPAEEARTPVAASEVVSLTAANLAALQADAEAGREARRILDAQERDRVLDDAVRTGRIAPNERENFAGSFAERPVADLATFLSGLTPRFGTVELGGASTEGGDEAAWDEFAGSVFGDEIAR